MFLVASPYLVTPVSVSAVRTSARISEHFAEAFSRGGNTTPVRTHATGRHARTPMALVPTLKCTSITCELLMRRGARQGEGGVREVSGDGRDWWYLDGEIDGGLVRIDAYLFVKEYGYSIFFYVMKYLKPGVVSILKLLCSQYLLHSRCQTVNFNNNVMIWFQKRNVYEDLLKIFLFYLVACAWQTLNYR